MKRYLLLILMFSHFCLFSQNKVNEKQIDSMLNIHYTSKIHDINYLEPLLTEAYYKSREIDYLKGKLESLLRLSAFYLNADKNPERVKSNLDEAEKIALEKNDYFYYCKAKALRAGILANQSSYHESAEMLEKSSAFFNRIRQKDRKIAIKAYYYARYINLYALQNKKDSTLFYARAMYDTALQLPDNSPQKVDLVAVAARVLTGIYTENKQFSKAVYYLKVQEKYLKIISNSFDIGMYHKTYAKLILDSKFRNESNLDTALYHLTLAEKHIHIEKSSLVLADLYSDIAEVYQAKKDKDNSLLYMTYSEKINQGSKYVRKTNVNHIINADLLIPEFDQEMMDSYKMKSYTFRTIYLFIVALVASLLALCFLLRRSASRKAKRQQSRNVIQDDSNYRIAELTHQALNGDKTFFIHFLDEFPDFGDKLIKINSNIKVSDIEFCALLKLNLQAKQIAEAKKMSVAAVTAKKGRIRKKLNINADENIYQWFLNV